MKFQKGNIPWNKGKPAWNRGKHLLEETRRKMSEARKGQKPWNTGKKCPQLSTSGMRGKHHTEENRRKQSEAKLKRKKELGYINSPETRRKLSEALKGRKLSKETIRKMSGENHWHWKGGKIPYYGPDWHQQRRLARERDNYTCLCGAEENGREHDVHHIVPYRISKDNSQDNLWTLCPRCHRRIEEVVSTGNGAGSYRG